MHRQLALRMQLSLTGSRRNHDRKRQLRAKNLRRGLNRTYIDHGFWNDTDPVEHFAIAPQRKFTLNALRCVVICLSREFRVSYRLEVERRQEFIESWNATVISEWILLGRYLRRLSQKSSQSTQRVSSRQARAPIVSTVLHGNLVIDDPIIEAVRKSLAEEAGSTRCLDLTEQFTSSFANALELPDSRRGGRQ